MVVEYLVPVPWQKQKKAYYCGPACIAMILKSRGEATPKQSSLWTMVKNNTFGNGPSSSPPEPGSFPTQECYLCGTWECWSTTPEALAAVINSIVGGGFTVRSRATQAAGTEIVIDALKSHTAPALPISTVSHWVVVSGVQCEQTTRQGVITEELLGVYVEDPQQASVKAQSKTRFRGVAAWQEDYAAVTCGPHRNDYVVVID
jgi:hypothetical protein